MRIVLSRLDRLGDLILSTPAIRALRRSYPQARMTLLCSPRNHVAVRQNPDIDEVLVAASTRESFEIAAKFRGVELAIALAPRTQDILFVCATRAQRRLGYTYKRRYAARAIAQLCLTQRLVSEADPAICDRNPLRPVQHEIDQLLALVQLAGADIAQPELVIQLQEADRQAVEQYPRGAIHLHLAPRWLVKGSSEESLIGILRELRIWKCPLIVSYADECAEVASRLAALKLADAVVGNLTFSTWAALMERAACVVTVDTSATHVASAMKRPTVVLFEHAYFALNAREWAPWNVPAAVVQKPAVDDETSLALCRKELVAAVGRLLSA